ncbi:MAG: hypothetical protein J7M21_06390, partial [Planctomycetes bacterium]|nr:hypothetical protein [Planctomycetota bacterium]
GGVEAGILAGVLLVGQLEDAYVAAADAGENSGFYAPGAPYMYPVGRNYRDPRINNIRWFGRRKNWSQPFSRTGGPLSDYLPSGMVEGCPSFENFGRGFEAGCGGFGYNNAFVGRYVVPVPRGGYRPGTRDFHLTGNFDELFAKPSETVAFTDAAFVAGGLIEYSFCEPPKWPLYGWSPRPSIHFRHLGRANVVWLDGRVTAERMTFTNDSMTGVAYQGSPGDYDVGWFGPRDDSLFDCK